MTGAPSAVRAPGRTAAPAAPTRARVTIPQYGLGRILAVWAAAAVPMGVLAWVVAPALASSFGGSHPLGRALLICLAAGLVWQFALVAGLVWFKQRTLHWSVLREALWLRAPRSPRTGRAGGKTWLVVVPLVAAFAFHEFVPSFPHPAARDFADFLGSSAGHTFFRGAWAWFALMLVMVIFNTVLGEELLFRGFLLPRMNGAFGRFDWVANGVLFGMYHVHVPWVIPAALLDTFVISYPSKRYRSALIGIAVHSAQSVFIIAVVLSLVIGR